MRRTGTPSDDEILATVSTACIAHKIRLLDRAVTAIYDRALRPHDLTISQMILLVVIAGTPDATATDVARRLHMDKSTLSRNLERMRSRGWLETVAPDTGRPSTVRVTPRGRRLLRQAHGAWSEAQERAARLLGEQGVDEIAATVEALSARLRPDG
jgi:DNA-binding MarR family transcriptional regulator